MLSIAKTYGTASGQSGGLGVDALRVPGREEVIRVFNVGLEVVCEIKDGYHQIGWRYLGTVL